MPSIYDIKPAFQGLLRPVTRMFAGIGVTANQVTVLAAVLSVLVGWAVYRYNSNSNIFWVLPVFLFVRMALNAIDGMLAREHNMKSDLGAFLNELGDVVSDSALYLSFIAVEGFSSILVVSVVLLACLSEMAGVVAVQIGASRRYEGPMGKSDRAFVFGVIGVVLAAGVKAGPWCNLLLCCIAAALLVTIYNRMRKALQEVK